jgi:hypothetical protein
MYVRPYVLYFNIHGYVFGVFARAGLSVVYMVSRTHAWLLVRSVFVHVLTYPCPRVPPWAKFRRWR